MTTTSLETLCRQVEQESAAATELPKCPECPDSEGQVIFAPTYGGNKHWYCKSCALAFAAVDRREEMMAVFTETARDFAPKAARALPKLVGELEELSEVLEREGFVCLATGIRASLASILAQFEQPKENA